MRGNPRFVRERVELNLHKIRLATSIQVNIAQDKTTDEDRFQNYACKYSYMQRGFHSVYFGFNLIHSKVQSTFV